MTILHNHVQLAESRGCGTFRTKAVQIYASSLMKLVNPEPLLAPNGVTTSYNLYCTSHVRTWCYMHMALLRALKIEKSHTTMKKKAIHRVMKRHVV